MVNYSKSVKNNSNSSSLLSMFLANTKRGDPNKYEVSVDIPELETDYKKPNLQHGLLMFDQNYSF